MTYKLYIPKNYKSDLDLGQTQYLIKEIKDFFQNNLAYKLNLLRVSAPIIVKSETGLNDNLSGIEEAVNFNILEKDRKARIEIVHSLAKWKRDALARYEIPIYQGIYADMNAIRAFEDFDNTHSLYVDQWDWEKVIKKEDRNKEYLHKIVNTIFTSLKELETFLNIKVNNYKNLLPDQITFVTSQELEDMYPDLTPEERESTFVKEKKAIFVEQIGDRLKSGNKHGDRSPDYDDWELNGDIIVYNPILDDALELSSMGIRVSEEVLKKQLTKTDNLDRLDLDYHKKLMNGDLPYTIGGGIGQSRLCMFFLQKAHIGEVQVSVWPQELIDECKKNSIILL